MNVTDLIKHKKVKAFLLSKWPKPKIDRSWIVETLATNENCNPSLTGNAFELFLRILTLKDNTDFNDEFDQELSKAVRNKVRVQKGLNKRTAYRDHLKLYLSKKNYTTKIACIKKVLSGKPVSIKEISKKFRYVVIENIKDVENLFLINKETDLLLAGIFNPGIWNIADPPTIIVDADSLENFIGNSTRRFKDSCEKFISDNKLNKSFVESVMEFTQISSSFFGMIDVIKGLSFTAGYIEYIYNLFNAVYPKQQLFNRSTIFKPSLRTQGILATPDFLLDSRILEIKTSKEFFSSNDYLQVLMYLIFAQVPQNKKKWGLIREVELYYPIFDKSVTIKIDYLDNRIKLSLKFLEAYVKEMRRVEVKKLKNLKARVNRQRMKNRN